MVNKRIFAQTTAPIDKVRQLHGLGLLICVVMFGVALYLQYVQGQAPCSLCIVQRLVVVVLGLSFLVAMIHHPKSSGQKLYILWSLLWVLLGVMAAGRHLWLLSLPQEALPGCGPSLNTLLQYYPVMEVVKSIFWASGECGKARGEFLGLSLPLWSLISDGFFLVLLCYQWLMLRRAARWPASLIAG